MVKDKDPFDAVVEMADSLFGAVEDSPPPEVRRFLADANCDTTDLKRRLYEKATELRGAYWERNVDPPAHLNDFIQQLRPIDARSTDPQQQRMSAHKWFKQLFDKVPVVDDASIAYSFHRRTGDVGESDEASLRELADRLKKKLQEGGQ
jgi:hypothetical protein